MDEFLATASHDVRSPLTVTMGEIALATRWFERLAAAVLEQSPDLADRVAGVRHCLDETSQSVDRLAGLVGVLFDTALVRSGKLEIHLTLCDLVALVRESTEAQRVANPSRTIDLLVAVNSPLPVEADAVRIGQVLTNYLTNALKYSGADQSVVVYLAQEGTEALIRVTDHGPGLSPQEQTRVWQAFYQVAGMPVQNGSSPGLGLGLHICKTIVERHGGRVGLESTVGKGSTFWFTLPLASER
jgi:signal transduction histidine kinase